jgi:hypothetical protein
MFRGLQVLKKWVSRFDLWPYVERFTLDVEREIMAELGQKPDLIVGNYSDGNLVASLLAHRMFVTQCNIAHAIEKTKYQDADIKWYVGAAWGQAVTNVWCLCSLFAAAAVARLSGRRAECSVLASQEAISIQ